MHEMSIAEALVAQLESLAALHGAKCITEVEVQCGELRQIVPEALQMAFAAAAQGTVATGAVLKLTTEHLLVQCRACGTQFAAKLDDYLCPQCRMADVVVLAGKEILLKAVAFNSDPR